MSEARIFRAFFPQKCTGGGGADPQAFLMGKGPFLKILQIKNFKCVFWELIPFFWKYF